MISATAARISFARQLGLAKRRRRVPRARFPTLIESDYAKQLVQVIEEQRQQLAPLIAELPELTASAWSSRGDAARLARLDIGEGRRVRQMMDLVRDRSTAPRVVEGAAERAARQVAAHGAGELRRQTQAALGVPLSAPDRSLPTLTEHFVSENVALIKSLGARTLDKVESAILRGFTAGARHETIAEEIAKEYSIAEKHARLIARDQIGKLHGQLNAARNQELGVTSYTWHATLDERTRPTHRALHGKVFAWANPPAEGLPGEAILCRCQGVPVFADIMAELDALERAP